MASKTVYGWRIFFIKEKPRRYGVGGPPEVVRLRRNYPLKGQGAGRFTRVRLRYRRLLPSLNKLFRREASFPDQGPERPPSDFPMIGD